jgi:hypothetical protein
MHARKSILLASAVLSLTTVVAGASPASAQTTGGTVIPFAGTPDAPVFGSAVSVQRPRARAD